MPTENSIPLKPVPSPIRETVTAEVVHIQQGGAQTVEATTVNVTQGGIQEVRAEQVTLDSGGIGKVKANTAQVTNGAIGIAHADQIVVNDGQVGIAVGKQIEGFQMNSVFLIAQQVNGDVNAVITERTAILSGAAFGAIIGIFLLLFTGKRR